jgi:hypothetical protein
VFAVFECAAGGEFCLDYFCSHVHAHQPTTVQVVLLPCRHLVACRPCAVNMVEFGAGGVIVAAEAEPEAAEPEPTPAAEPAAAAEGTEGTTAPTEGAEGAPAAPAAEGTAAPAATPAPAPVAAVPAPAPTRRKRKAKGWFCPVCRQRECYLFFGHVQRTIL